MHGVMRMTRKNVHIGSRFLGSLAISSSILLAALDAQAAVSQSPLSLTVGVPPNMIFTLDDSTSMNRAFVPDVPGDNNTQDRNDIRHTARAKSASFNKMYYDPTVVYRAPASFNSSGQEVTLSAPFTAAPLDGFEPEKNSSNDKRDLSSDYQPAWVYNRSTNGSGAYSANSGAGLTSILARHPDKDFKRSVNITKDNTTVTETSPGGVRFTISRGNKQSNHTCKVKVPGLDEKTVTCSRNNNTYTADFTQEGVPAYYYVYDTTACTTSNPNDDDCYRLVFPETSAEKSNFAIWYSFYRTRALATLSASSIAFYDLSSTTRLTWQSLIHCTTLNSTAGGKCGSNQFRTYDNAHRQRFFNWLQNTTQFDLANGTPLRSSMVRAGEFLKDSDIAWHKTPGGTGNTTENTYACRPSYHIVMTDGMWTNTNENTIAPSRHDNASFELPDGKSYPKDHPYVDSTNSTLADVAMHYWATDLRSGMANKLQPFMPYKTSNGNATDAEYWDPRNNPATWQHMVNYMMGLGLSESLNHSGIQWQGSTFASGSNGNGFKNLKEGTNSWPAASSGSMNNVYDLWHAAINSRGEFFSVDSPDAMVTAFSDILAGIGDMQSSASRPAMNSGQMTEDEIDGTIIRTVSYQTTYASNENWSGDLIRTEKERLLTENNALDRQRTVWRASEQLPAHGSRNIKMPNASSNGLQAFTWSNAGDPDTEDTLAYYLRRNPESGTFDNASAGEARLNYLRGNRAGEGTTYRLRSSVLGDMYSSTPVAVSKARYLVNMANSIEKSTSYTNFANSVMTRKGMVYVGGNDGMLHGFNAQTGREEFAFVPKAVFPTLNKLTGTNYNHHFYVDGSPVVADIYDSGTWKTILVGTLRAGGKSVFALDITNPDSIQLLWEFDDSKITDPDAVKMGYSFSKPTVARLNSGRWAVVFGNGYEARGHTNGKAALFVLDAANGTLLKSLEVAGAEGLANGLSTPKLSDYNADGIAEFAYAGDLQGNLWRFNLHADNASNFSVAYGSQPMFKAVTTTGSKRQSITAAPSLVRHPTGNGYLVIFGTGKYFEDGDKDGDKSVAQSLYGIWDRYTRLVNDDISESNKAISIDRSSDLAVQTIYTTTTATNQSGQNMSARAITDNNVSWYDEDGDVNKLGWRLDFQQGTRDGEMLIDDMATLGRSLFLQTLVPNDDPCADGATNWTYAINPYTGGRLRHNALILSAPSLGRGIYASGQQQTGEGGLTIAQKPDGNFEVCTGTTCQDVMPDPASIGRQSWRPADEVVE